MGGENSEDSEGGTQAVDRAEEDDDSEAEMARLDLQPYIFEPPAQLTEPCQDVQAEQSPIPNPVSCIKWVGEGQNYELSST